MRSAHTIPIYYTLNYVLYIYVYMLLINARTLYTQFMLFYVFSELKFSIGWVIVPVVPDENHSLETYYRVYYHESTIHKY